MIFDFRAADCASEIQADLCVIGAGAAGLTIAHAFAGSNLSVCIVESGGLTPESDTQELYEGELVGLPLGSNLSTSRFRMFGGSTYEWGGGCIPLNTSDMEVRDWVPYSGWPISRQELDPFYDRARPILALPDHPFFDERLAARLSRTPLRFDPALLAHAYSMGSGYLRLGELHWPRLAKAQNLTILLNANLLELEVNENGTVVERASLLSLQGRKGYVRARHFVLACGGIENARLLLLSDSTNKNGLGNDHDLVGRFFMDHPKCKFGCIASDPPEKLTAAYDPRLAERKLRIFPQIALSWTLQQKEQVLNGRLRPDVVEQDAPDGIVALRKLRCDLANGARRGLLPHILRIIADLDEVIPCLYRYLLQGLPAVRECRIDFNGFFEQAPNPHSRVSLGKDTDALGQRKVRVDWQLTDLDRKTYQTAATVFAKEIARLDLGKVLFDPWVEPSSANFQGVEGAAHHMGTTRMSDDPRSGVVDRDCRVHDMENLYVAGSSVFPTGGWAFPTFTIAALALRLSDVLRQRLVSEGI